MSIDLTRRQKFYQACSGCRKEFFNKEEFESHPCIAAGTVFDPKMKLGTNGKVQDLKGTTGNTSPKTHQDILANSSENTSGSEVTDALSVDLRLDAVKEITKIKQELVLAGIEAQTMSADEARAAYKILQDAKTPNITGPNEIGASDSTSTPTSNGKPRGVSGKKNAK